MSFTNSKVAFTNNKTFDEKLYASGLGKGMSSFVTSGLELTGTTITAGTFCNGGVFGQLGNEGETQEISPNVTGFIAIISTLDENASVSIIVQTTNATPTSKWDTSNEKKMLLYELDNGVIINDYRHIEYIKSIVWEKVPADGPTHVRQIINGFKGPSFDFSPIAGGVTSVNGILPDIGGNVQIAVEEEIFDEESYVEGDTIPSIAGRDFWSEGWTRFEISGGGLGMGGFITSNNLFSAVLLTVGSSSSFMQSQNIMVRATGYVEIGRTLTIGFDGLDNSFTLNVPIDKLTVYK